MRTSPLGRMAQAAAEGLFDDERGSADLDVLDACVGAMLTEAGIWPEPRASDGVGQACFKERTRTRVCVAGRIWTVDDQVEHTFWLELDRQDSALCWSLRFDVDVGNMSPRRVRNLPHTLVDPNAVDWVHEVSGQWPDDVPDGR